MFFPMFSLKTLNNHRENMAHVFAKKSDNYVYINSNEIKYSL